MFFISRMNRSRFQIGKTVAAALLAVAMFPGCDSPNVTSVDPETARWKHATFGDLEFFLTQGNNGFGARIKGESSADGQVMLGTRGVIIVKCVLTDTASKSPEALAIYRMDEKYLALTAGGRKFPDLEALNLSPVTLNRIRQELAQPALKSDLPAEQGIYEGIVVLFPASCLPLRTVDQVKIHLRGLLVELILEKVRRMGNGKDGAEARYVAKLGGRSQYLFFMPNYAVDFFSDTNGVVDGLKAMQLLTNPDDVPGAAAHALFLPIAHKGESGRVLAVDALPEGYRVILESPSGNRTEQVGLVEVSVKIGDPVASGTLIGVIKNPRHTDRK
jgi:hypothetical protein